MGHVFGILMKIHLFELMKWSTILLGQLGQGDDLTDRFVPSLMPSLFPSDNPLLGTSTGTGVGTGILHLEMAPIDQIKLLFRSSVKWTASYSGRLRESALSRSFEFGSCTDVGVGSWRTAGTWRRSTELELSQNCQYWMSQNYPHRRSQSGRLWCCWSGRRGAEFNGCQNCENSSGT